MYIPPISNKPSVPAAEFEPGGEEQMREVENFVQADQQLLADLLAGRGKTEEIEIAKIKCDGDLLIRDSHDEDKIRELAAKVQNGVELAAIIVARAKNGEFLLVDGNQRLIAHLKCNLTHITAFVISGDISDAIRLRLLANASHGVPLNRNEKRRTRAAFC